MLFAGRDAFYEHVKNYELEFSADGVSWEPYKENGSRRVSEKFGRHATLVTIK